ncbi:hypothetical protein [Sporichthya polymorpha]|uniref:hypothetical protein n=1 Tax=Sporichthya polymorpha TaxID=35751 RepID=UPI00035F261C|nr:hypothetical protein [Sporichthya polymorpha]
MTLFRRNTSSRRWRRPLGVAVAATLAMPLVTIAAPETATAAPPRQVPCGQVELAPVLKTDVTDTGQQIQQKADRRGVYVPIIMVPDYHGRAKHDDSRTGDFSRPIDMGAGGPAPAAPRASLIGQLQQIPGAAVYTFDYRTSAGNWVDDPGIGPALGDAIDCVTSALGQKAILITHGVGGLAARWAVGGQVEGRDRGSQVTTVIGYGSPQTGSQLAELLNTGVGSTASEPRTVLRLLVSACRALKPAVFTEQAPCGFLPVQAGAFARAGGDAFRGQSPQHLALRPYPNTVRVHAFAGDVVVNATNLGWFGLKPFRANDIPLGDLVSSTASTTIQALSQLRASCRFTLDAFGTPAQSAGIRLAEIGAQGAAWPFPSTIRPCFAPSLPRVSQFADRIRELLTNEIRNRQPLDLRELESLAVPSVCGHPAGTLVGGRLPGIAPGNGEVALASTLDPNRFNDFTSFGDLTGDGVADTVAVLKCSTAAGPGADVVVAYDSGARLLGSINLADVTGRPVNEIYNVQVSRGQAIMRWRTTEEPTTIETVVDAEASFTFDPNTGLRAGALKSFNVTGPVGKLLEKIRAGRSGAEVRKLAPPEIITAMITAHRQTPFGEATCYGPSAAPNSNWPEQALDDYDDWPPQDGLAHGDRFCLIALPDGHYALLGMVHTGFSTWRAVEFRLPERSSTPGGGGLFPGDDDDDDDGPGGIGPLF